MEEQQEPVKLSKSVLNIEGTKPNVQSGQLLISSGVPSIDDLLGGGYPVGTLILIEEDQHGTYAKIMLKYFLAEGIVNHHSTLVASQDTSTESIMQELPSAIDVDPDPSPRSSAHDQKMKIAFRYQHLPTAEKSKRLEFGHHYDLTKIMSRETIDSADVVHWQTVPNTEAPNTFSNPAYHHLLQSIKDKINSGSFSVSHRPERRSILRIGLHALGSPMWLTNAAAGLSINQNRDLNMFLFCLRALIRSAFAVAVITVPSHLLDEGSLDRCIYTSDIVIRLQAFAGTELETNPVLSDYHGYFHVVKLAAINTFVSKHPGSVEYVFKLRRRKFCIEKLHLPPSLEDSGKSDTPPTMGCGSSSKHLLEF